MGWKGNRSWTEATQSRNQAEISARTSRDNWPNEPSLKGEEKEEVLLRWEGQPKEDAVWVDEEWLKGSYPHLEGKVF
jgi:hypothetical protein